MIQIVYYIIFGITVIYGIYFLITGIFAFKKPNNKKEKTKKINNFAILIAARNEECVIGNLIQSLNNQKYPADSFEIYVVINNCTDKTKEEAERHRAKIIECTGKISSKADALNFAFKSLKTEKEIDAYLIFDADNIVDKNFLHEMNKIINKGYNVAEGFRESKNLSDNWISGSYSLFYYLQNFFINKSRMNLNLSASINGTAFMVKKHIIDDKGFNIKTLTEDMEFTAICSLIDEKIAFAEKAITYDEQPLEFGASWKQRKRWTKGMLQCLKFYHKPLLKKIIKDKSLYSLDILMIFLAPIIQIISFILVLLLIMFKIFGIKLYDIFSYLLSYGLIFCVVTYLIGVIINILIMIYNKHKIKDSVSGILLFAFFIITWIPINIICLFQKNIKWDRIKHTRNINIDTLLNTKK